MVQTPPNISIVAVTKYSNLKEVELTLKKYPQIKDIAENRYPDLKEKFK